MGANDAALNIILGSHDETGPGVASAEGKIGKLKGSVAGMAQAWAVMGGATATAVGFLADASREAAADQASVDRLAKAVDNSGGSWKDSQAAIEARIAAGQDLAFTDDQTRDSLAMLVAQTGSVDEALKRNKLAMDLARGGKIDLATASKLLGKSTEENANTFAKLGIVIEKGASQEEVFAAIQQKFGGQAKVYGDSTAGTIDRLKDKFAEWKESVGASMGPAQAVLALLPGMSAGFSAVGAASGFLSAELTILGDRSILMVAKTAIVRAATAAWTAVQWLLNVALSANPIGLVVIAIGLLVAGFVYAYKNIQPFRDFINALWADMQRFGNWLSTNFTGMIAAVGKLLGDIASGNYGAIIGDLHNLHVPGFAHGGIVPGAIGAPQLILAHGGEEVIPNDRPASSSSVTNHYNLTLVGAQAVNDPDGVRRMLQRVEYLGRAA